jgi:hypothetical protein
MSCTRAKSSRPEAFSRMTMPSRFKGFVRGRSRVRSTGFASFDALLSLVPILLMMLFLMQSASSLTKKAQETAHRQQVFDKLVSAADYTVKIGAARREGAVRHPNWLDERLLTASYADSLKEKEGLSSLYVSLGAPGDGYAICIYRLVVVGDGKDMHKLYVCGG